jgi:hypothetical protein
MTIQRPCCALQMTILWLTASPVLAALPPKADFYVSPKGNDEWSGFLAQPSAAGTDGPLASISGARDAIRRLKARGKLDKPILVAISGGTYRVTKPIVFAVEASGSKTTPITHAA